VTRRLQMPGTPVYQQIVETFGPDILAAPGGALDRQKLAAIVFNDPAALHRIEQIVHPAVHAELVAWLAQVARDSSRPVAVIDAIKLLEDGWKPHCNAVWVVTSTPEQQMQRLIETRGMSKEEARQRIAAQPPQADKVAQADLVIDNSGTLEQTRAQVEAAWQHIIFPQEG